MKRVCFKPEFVEPIRSGRKTATMRFNPLPVYVGDVVAAVTSQDGKPAFFAWVEDRFATLRIDAVFKTTVETMTTQQAWEAGFATLDEARKWYLARRDQGDGALWGYAFEVVE